MKAVRVLDGVPTLVDADRPCHQGPNDVLVDVVSTSICGSDLHLLRRGAVEGRILGHEFAGYTSDGRAVAIEPLVACHECDPCNAGHRSECAVMPSFLGILTDGGMAEQVAVDARMLVALPSGLDVAVGALVEPVAVAVHVVGRIAPQRDERICVVGGGTIGLAVCAVLRARGVVPVLRARHEHQRLAGARLGADVDADARDVDIVVDAVGTTESLAESVQRVRYRGRIGLVGSLWEPASLGMALCIKEASIVPAMMYAGRAPDRDVDVAALLLAERAELAQVLVTHRFPLDAVAEGFAAAADRGSGAIKVLFDVSHS